MNRLLIFLFLFFTWFVCVGQTETVTVTTMQGDTLEVIQVTPWQMDGYLLYSTADFGDAMKYFINPQVDILCSEDFFKFMLAYRMIDVAPEYIEFRDILKYSEIQWDTPSEVFIPTLVIHADDKFNMNYGHENLPYLLTKTFAK
jgi:hypothetical protein